MASIPSQGQGKLRFNVHFDPQIAWLSSSDHDAINPDGSIFHIEAGIQMDYFFQDNYAFVLGFGISNMGGRLIYGENTDYVQNDEPVSILAGQLSKKKRVELVKMIKYLPLTIVSSRPIEEATITRGGVSTDGIEPKTMVSKVCEGLYFAGEVMDVDGPCGGYNLQIAWSTGALAGRSAAKYVSGK